MIKIVVLVCQIMSPLQCTENTAEVVVLADHEDDGMPCKALGNELLRQLRKNPEINNTIMVACEKDGKPYF